MKKNEKTEQEPEKETTTVIGATDKMEIPDYISEVVMPVDPFVKVALLLPFSAKDYPVFVDTLVEKMPVQISARSEQFISFYDGLLLSVDSLKYQGYKFNLKFFIIFQTPLQRTQMEFSLSVYQRLLHFFRLLDHPCRLFFTHTVQDGHHLFHVPFVPRFTCTVIFRFRIFDQLYFIM